MRILGQISLPACLLSALCVPVAAQSGAYVPDYQVEMPRYWSGTNCRAYGNLYVYPGIPGIPIAPQFDDAQLYVGGTLVRTWSRGGGDTPHHT